MSAVNVILIRRVDHGQAVGTQCDVLNIELSGREDSGEAAASRNRVQVIPAILLRREDNSILASEIERSVC